MPNAVQYESAPAPTKDELGSLSNLATTNKTSAVAAINEVNNNLSQKTTVVPIGLVYSSQIARVNVESNGRYILFAVGPDSARTAIYSVYVSGGGAANPVQCIENENFVADRDTNSQFYFINNSTGVTYLILLCLVGSASVASIASIT